MTVRTGPALARSIRATTTSPKGNGLLWSNTSRPMIGYGFQDSLFKSGEVLYSSVSCHDTRIADIWLHSSQDGSDAVVDRCSIGMLLDCWR